MYLHSPVLEVGSWWRVDTASGTNTPTTVYAHDGADAIPTALGASGSTVRGNTRDGTGLFWSSTATLYCKELTYQGVPTGTVVTSAGVTPTTPSGAPVDIATISTLVAALPTTYVQLLVTDATSTTLTGALTAGHLSPVDCTAGAGARTLPAASSVAAGTPTVAKKADSSANALVVSRAGSDLIFGTGAGSTSKTLTLSGEAVTFVSNGVDRWSIESSDTPVSQLDLRYPPIAATPVASAATSGTLTAAAEHNLSPSSAAAWTLPTGVTATRLPTTVKNNGTATITVARGGSDTINGGTASVSVAAGEWARFTSDGAGGWTQSGTAGQSSIYVQRTYEGSNLFVYGHSFTMVPGAYCTQNGGEWASRVANRLSMNALVRGVSGSKMGDVAQGAIGSTWPGSNGSKTLAAASQGLVIIEAECNDYMFDANVANAAYQLGFKHSLRSFFAAASAGSRVDSSTATATGTWSTLAGTTSGFSGGSIKYTQTQNDHIDWAGVSAPAGYIYLLTLANDSANGTGTLAIAVDGTDQGVSYTGQGQMKQYTSGCGGGTIAFVPAVIKVTVPASGTHTITVTKTDASGGSKSVYVDALLIPSTTPPPILVLKDPQTDSTAAATVGGTLAAAYTTYSPTYHGLIDTVVAEFTNAHALDLATGWVPSTMQSSLDTSFRFHPNDLGMAQIADSVQAWIKANLTQYATGLTTA